MKQERYSRVQYLNILDIALILVHIWLSLNNYDLTLCQDVTLNTAQAKEMMYAITWNESKTHRVQVGITPKRLLKELKQNQISNVVSNMPVYKGMEIYVVNSKTKIIEGATDKNKIGKKILTSNKNYQYIT